MTLTINIDNNDIHSLFAQSINKFFETDGKKILTNMAKERLFNKVKKAHQDGSLLPAVSKEIAANIMSSVDIIDEDFINTIKAQITEEVKSQIIKDVTAHVNEQITKKLNI